MHRAVRVLANVCSMHSVRTDAVCHWHRDRGQGAPEHVVCNASEFDPALNVVHGTLGHLWHVGVAEFLNFFTYAF